MPRRRRGRSLLGRLGSLISGTGDRVGDSVDRARIGAVQTVQHRKSGRLKRPVRILILVAAVVLAVVGSFWVRERGGGSESVWERDVRAAALYERGDHAGAAALYGELAQEVPGNLRFQFYSAAARIELGDDTGWVDIARLAEIDDAPAEAALLHGRRLLEDARAAEAAPYLERGIASLLAAEATSDTSVAAARWRRLLATVYIDLGREADAIPHLTVVAHEPELDPLVRIETALTLARMHAVRGVLRAAAARERRLEVAAYQLARELTESEIARVGGTATLHSALARSLLAMEQPGPALAQVDFAIQMADADELAELHLLRARIGWVIGRPELARSELQIALTCEPPPGPAQLVAGAELLRANGLPAEAQDVLRAADELHPDDLVVGLALAQIELAADGAPAAVQRLERLAVAHPDSPRPSLALGDVSRSLGDLTTARTHYEEALRRRPGDTAIELRLAGAGLSETGSSEGVELASIEALEARAREILEVSADSAAAQLALGKALLARLDHPTAVDDGDRAALFDEAAAALARSIELDPLQLEAHAFLAYADLRAGGRAAEAVLGFERVLSALPDDRPRLRLLLVESYLGAGLVEQALEAAEAVVVALPEERRALELLLRAQVVLRRLDGALETLGRLERLDPDSLDIVLDQAFVLSGLGRITAAEARFRRAMTIAEAIEEEDARLDALARVADAKAGMYARTGDFDRGAGVYDELVAATGGRSEAHLSYGRYLLGLGRVDDARREYQAALLAAPREVAPRRALCELLFRENELGPELDAQLEEIAALDPTSLDLDYLRGKLALARGDVRLARDLLERYVAERDDDADGHYALGLTYLRASRFEDAVRELNRADGLMPGSPEVRIALAKTRYAWAQRLLHRGRMGEAAAALRAAAADDPDAAEPRRLLAATLSLSGDAGVTERELRIQLRRTPDDVVLLRMLVMTLASTDRLDEARTTLARVLQLDPADWSAWGLMSTIHLRQDDLDRAEIAARRAREEAPGEPASIQAVVLVLLETDRADEALSALAKAEAESPREGYYPYLHGLTLRTLGRAQDALAATRRALQVDPELGAAFQLGVGLLDEDLQDPEGALEFAAEHLDGMGDQPGPRFLYALQLRAAGQLDAARDTLTPLVMDTEVPFLPAVIALVQVEVAAGDYRQARLTAETAGQAYPANGDMHYLVAETHLRELAETDNVEERSASRDLAVRSLRRCLELAPDHARAANNLAYLLRGDEEERREALALVDDLVLRFPSRVPYLHTRAQILLELDDPQRALQTLKEALRVLDERETLLAEQVRDGVPANLRDEVAKERARLERWRADVTELYPRVVAATEEGR